MSSKSQISPQVQETINQFFENSSTWSLLSFLQYRKGVDDFTYDKVKEHMLYKSTLDLLSKDHDQARSCLLSFEIEKSSESVDAFWTMIQKKCYEDQINTIRADGVFHMFRATNQSQQHVTNIQHQDLLGLYPSEESKLRGTLKRKERSGYTTPCPNSPIMEDNPEDESRSKRRTLTKTDDKSCTSSGTNDDSYESGKSDNNESSESDEDDEDECELRLNVEDIGFEQYIDQGVKPFVFKTKNISSLFESYRSKASTLAQGSGLLVTKNYHEILSLSHILLLQTNNYSEMQVKTFSRETLEDLRKNIKSNFIGKEKVTRDVKSILQGYIEVALDDNDGGLYKLREMIIESFSKTFNSKAEKEFFQRMQFLFQHLSYTIPSHSLKEKISEGTLVANLISPVLRIFFHDSYLYPTIWPNTSSTSAKVRKLAVGDPSRAKQPDMIGKMVNNGKFVYETMFGEVTGEGKNNTEKKSLIDLIRLGIFMKDSLDIILKETGINRIFAWQVIVTKWTGYLMTLISPGIYLMIDTGGSVELPRDFETCSMFLNGLDMLHTFQIAYEQTVKEIFLAINKNEEDSENDGFKTWRRSTLGTPAFKRIVKFK